MLVNSGLVRMDADPGSPDATCQRERAEQRKAPPTAHSGLGNGQTELALLLGASRTRINAALGVLENDGAIGRTADRLFCDKAKLAQAARMDTTSQ